MRNISSRVAKIYESYYSDKSRQRYKTLVDYANHFLKTIPFTADCLLRVDEHKMLALVDSYFLDVIRFKDYHFRPNGDFPEKELFTDTWNQLVHGEKLLSPPKVAALSAKWILKYSPLIIIPKNGVLLSSHDRTLLNAATAMFAFQFAIVSMGLSPRNINLEIRRNIIYHFRFRQFEERSFMLLFETLMTSYGREAWAYASIDEVIKASMATEGATPSQATDVETLDQKIGTRYLDSKTYSVYISMPNDCQAEGLSNAAIWETELINNKIKENFPEFQTQKFVAFVSRQDDDESHSITKKIAEARKTWGKDTCDIFISASWNEYDDVAVEEYNYFVRNHSENNNGVMPAMLFCEYNAEQDGPGEHPEIDPKLNQWIKNLPEQTNMISDSPTTEVREYQTALSRQLNRFLDDPADQEKS